jgi:hypothetical protein
MIESLDTWTTVRLCLILAFLFLGLWARAWAREDRMKSIERRLDRVVAKTNLSILDSIQGECSHGYGRIHDGNGSYCSRCGKAVS